MLQTAVHYCLHFLAIGLIAYFYDKQHWKKAWLILIATMAVDIDHIFATPLFDPTRCGIGYHPLHSEIAILGYIIGAIVIRNKLIKLIFIGLLFHMFTDLIDCLWTFSKCETCYIQSKIYEWMALFKN
ncbi:DUF6122 family protein [Gillisia sp. M10.2A]|uniref:DUF6122 family protein n=1 Tax=Gillisia lutea TaxID=2909668 RepID=A0ABS9EKF0_9FLAO|nr:DUF6122 family protein [Gillisia lutea]MCF4101973.1 DUF6122 family protein [Gillisia lutea]